MISLKRARLIGDGFTYAALSIISVFAVFPLIWMLLSSVKTTTELTQHSDRLFPRTFTLEFFERVLKKTDYLHYMGNSVFIAFIATLVSLVLSALAAYALVRFYPRQSRWFMPLLIIAYMFPHILLVIPFFNLINNLGMSNTMTGLIITYVSFSIPFSMWLLTGFFRAIPLEIEEASRIDGTNKIETFVKIVVPLAAPGLVATGIYTFINAWNEFLFSLVLISSGSKKTLSVGLYSLVGGETLQYGDMLAASTMFIIPSLIFFFFVQRHMVQGLTGGAVK